MCAESPTRRGRKKESLLEEHVTDVRKLNEQPSKLPSDQINR